MGALGRGVGAEQIDWNALEDTEWEFGMRKEE